MFLVYYDILVRNAFGNYRDILLEMSFNPLMAESLSFLDSSSLAFGFARNGKLSFPDENYAREIMQLFTIGLHQLKDDGTPLLDTDGNPMVTYDNNNIVSFSRVWTGFTRQAKRANVEGPDGKELIHALKDDEHVFSSTCTPFLFIGTNRIDPMAIVPYRRDKFPKPDLYGGFLGDGEIFEAKYRHNSHLNSRVSLLFRPSTPVVSTLWFKV